MNTICGIVFLLPRHRYLTNITFMIQMWSQLRKVPLTCAASSFVISDSSCPWFTSAVFAKVFARKMSSLDACKRAAAYRAVDKEVEDNNVVGIGSGSTVIYAVERLAHRVQTEDLRITCIPSSFQSQQLINSYYLKLGSLETNPQLDVVIDGADEVDENMTLIKGGGGCLLQEKIVASCTDRLIIIGDYTKNSVKLGENWDKGIPIEVIPLAYIPVRNKIKKLFGGEVELRMAKMKAGPVITDNGNFLLDWKFCAGVHIWEELNKSIKMIPGVVETGLFVDMAKRAYFGTVDGGVIERYKKSYKLEL